MFQDPQYSPQRPIEQSHDIGYFIGIVLIIMGSILSLWVFMKVIQILGNPEQIKSFLAIFANEPEMRQFLFDDKTTEIPMVVIQFLAYSFCAFFLLIAGSIGTSFIKGGIVLMGKDVNSLLQKVKEGFMSLKNAKPSSGSQQ